MVTTIKKKDKKERRENLLKKALSSGGNKAMDAIKFCGTVAFNEDAIVLQKPLER